ncbi:MAG: tetratricopeptide repeat protein [Acidobacteria bacterium]|nr:tetratricopeptide repeat protein [Acidobacteriota bacterium]
MSDNPMFQNEDDPLIGRTLDGKYQLESQVGIGGMAVVYLARRLHIGDKVAVKVLNTGVPLSDVDLQRFELEARSAAKIKHPNIVSIFDFGTTSDGLMYLVMELLEGSSLEKELEEKTSLDLDRTLELIQPMCEAVNAAHAEGLIHRDLKPSNILLHRLKDGSEIVKVVDFGVAKLTNVNDTAYKERLTKTGYLVGTPHYMSPEQIREQEITLKSDIYSLGVIIYEMLTGCLPFNSDNVIDLLLAHLENSAKPMRDLSPNVPTGVDDAILKALSKDPSKRQSSARELYQQIVNSVRGEPTGITSENLRHRTTPSTGMHLQQSQRNTLSKAKRANLMVYDTLTGLYNNVFMNLRLDNEIAESKTSGDRTSVLLFGIDSFKNINQRHGFVVGDSVLKEFGLWLEQSLGDVAVVGRYRGDEFIAIFSKTDGKTAMQKGQEALELIKEGLFLKVEGSNTQIQVNSSVGVAQFPGDGENAPELVEQAYLGMRQAKTQGINQIYWLKQVQTLTSLTASYSFDNFVGRKSELEKLEREFDRILTNQGRTVCITGDTGIGKKRLAEEFRRRLTGKDVMFLQGRFYESSQAIPYKTIYDSLHSHLSLMIEENFDHIRALFGNLADKIVKDFQEGESFRFFNSTVQTGSEQEKYVIFDYLTKIFIGLAKEHPLVCFLEDMQWADSLSLEFLAYLSHNTNHNRILLVGCARTEGLADKHPFRLWLRNIGRSGAEILQLQALSESEVAQMVEVIFPRIVFSPSTIRMLYRETKGNPYFLVEVLKYLIDENIISFSDGVWRCEELENLTLPRSIVDVVEALLGRMDDELLDIFSKAAVIGEEFAFGLLQKVTKLDEDELLDFIDNGLKAQLIKERDNSGKDEIYGFYHSIIQKVLYSRLNRRLRRTLHSQVGEALEKINRSNPNKVAGELGYHFHYSGAYQKSFKYNLEAGLRAWRVHSVDEAERFLAWSLEAAGKLGFLPGSDEAEEEPTLEDFKQTAELTLNYGQILINAGKLESATNQLENALELAKQQKDELLEARVYNALAELYEASSKYQSAIDYCNKAISIADKLGDKAIKAASTCFIGTTYDRLGQYDKAIDAFKQAIEIAKDLPSSISNATARRELAFTLIRRSSYKEALALANEALKLSQSSNDRLNEMIAHSIIGQIYFNQGDLKKASSYYETALKMASQLNRRRGQAIELFNIGEVHRTQGHYRQAIDCIQRSLEISREVGERQSEALAKFSLGLIYQATDSLNQAFETLNQALQQQRDVSNKSAEAYALLALAEIHLERKNYEETEFLAKQASELAEKLGNPNIYWQVHFLNARLYIVFEKIEEACDALRSSVGTIESMCDQLSNDVDRQTFLADKHGVYDLLTELMENQ